MALKKSQLYSSLWQSCDELRGGMDASQYKDYVLTLLFMKYVSDRYASKKDAVIEVPAGGSFADMVKLKGDKEIGDKVNKIIGRLAEANDLKGVIDQADFNDEDKLGRGKEMQDRLSKLVAIFDGLDFRANLAEGDDLLGDAYEYLMRHFATDSGKSKGQFYTPAEVSRIMAQVLGIERAARLDQPTVYDPTCGSGSLLIKAADEAATRKLAIYGQEMDVATWGLARMNMILHNQPAADLWRGNTLAAPHFKNKDNSLKTFDFAVANPPFSSKAWSNGWNPVHDEFDRFEYGVPPIKNGDYAFLLHLVKSLKSKGPPALLVARYFAEEQAAIEEAQARADEATQMLEEFVEENTGEEGLLADAADDKGNVTKAGVNARLREIGDDPEFAEEQRTLEMCLKLLETEALAKKAVKTLQEKLDQQVLEKYPKLTVAEIKTLAVDDKWFASIESSMEGEVQRLTQQLTARVRELEERYAQPLAALEREVEAFGRKVEGHLKKMGVMANA